MKNALIIGLLAVMVVAAACAPTLTPPQNNNQQQQTNVELQQGTYALQELFDPDAAVEAKAFGDLTELESFLASHQESSSPHYYATSLSRGVMVDEEMTMDSAQAMPVAVKAGGNDGANIDYSETNNQVAGVDEGDIIKTDGNYIYTTSGSTLFIIDAYPGEEADVLSSMALEKGSATGLFINGNTLVVFGTVNNNDIWEDIDFRPTSGATYVEIYDVTDKTSPKKVKEYLFEGSYLQSRMIGKDAYLITQTYPWMMPRPLPMYAEDGVAKEMSLDTIRYFPMPYDNVMYTSVHAISLESLASESLTLAVESSAQVYMSEDNLYLAYTKYVSEWNIERQITIETITPLLSKDDKELVQKIKLVDDDVLSQSEKENKIYNLITNHVQYLPSDERDELQETIEQKVKDELDSYDYYEYTVINKVSVDGLDIEAVANGKVPGYLNNQFAMDEDNDVLRLATTVSARWSSYATERSDSENMVFTLDDNLDELDRLEGIAKTESIYSTRFIDDRLYLVTFRQTDPFFVIDLSNPKNIRSLGELKIPGFSRYLHPYDENIIIGLGRDATELGRQQGLKISLFDVSDVSKPTEIVNWVGDEKYAQSAAEYEHKAFLFSKAKNLLVIPAYSYEWDSGDGYNGAFVFDISENAIELRGLIDHADGAQYSYGSAVERSLYIEDELYTKSYGLLRINALDDLHGIKNIELDQVKIGGKIPVY